ncbi:MAG: hypothetical protein JWO09_2324 [Bacteroidetes bacterium]|nr:hypothetical protein [Bacteroidota bacterium]
MRKLLLAIIFIAASLYSGKVNAQALPATYFQQTIVTGLAYPVDFDWAPDGRYFITLKGGNSTGSCSNGKILVYSAAGALIGTFYDLTDSVNCDFERGLLGIALDPAFATNHYVYVYYVHKYGTANSCRVLRFTEAANVGTSPTIICDINLNGVSPAPAGNHFGGMIRFRPTEPDKIYFCIGDLAYQQGNPTLNYANKLNKPWGKILRINSNGTIPTDNPFYDDGNPATGNDDRIWSYGHRNGFGMTFSPLTDTMYYSENGWNAYDEYNVIHKGGNYGWATCEGDFVYNTSTPCTGFINPIATWGAPLGGITGTVYYSGTTMPEFNNHILVADNDYGRIYDLTLGNAPAYDMVTSKVIFADIVTPTGVGITTLREGADGCLYAMKGGYTTNGQIYRICHVGTGIATMAGNLNYIGQNYPNPSTGETQIDYSISDASEVMIELYDVTGRKVKTILNGSQDPGDHTVTVSGLDKFAEGSYFYKIEVKQNGKTAYTATKRLMIVK